MKRCPITAKIAGLIGILPRLFDIVVWLFAWVAWPLWATILCVWKIWSGSNNSVYNVFHWLAKKKGLPKKNIASPYWICSWPMTRNQRLFCFGLSSSVTVQPLIFNMHFEQETGYWRHLGSLILSKVWKVTIHISLIMRLWVSLAFKHI